jgi:MFS family permease
VLLVVLRFVQGLSLGGEWGGAVLLSMEHSSRRRWGLAASWVQFGVPAGNIAAVGMLAFAGLVLSDTAFETWGWRLPFLASAALALVGLWVRRNIAESPMFTRQTDIPDNPLSAVFRSHRRALTASFCVRIGVDVAFYIFTLYLLTHLTDEVGVPESVGLVAVVVGSAVQLVLIPWFGRLSDVYGRKGIAVAGTVAAAVWAWVFFPLLDTGSTAAIIAAVTVALVAHAAMYGPQAAFIAEMFPTKVRYSGTSLGYQLAGVPGGALAPIAAQALAGHGINYVGLYLVAAGILSLGGIALLRQPATR